MSTLPSSRHILYSLPYKIKKEESKEGREERKPSHAT
jgi:hypothetical protein